MTLVIWAFIVAALFFVGALWLKFRWRKREATRGIIRRFGLDVSKYNIVSADLGDVCQRQRLFGFGLVGEPDAVFRSRSIWKQEWVVGEFKSRHHKGYVRPNELFQVMLYMGLVREHYRASRVRGVLQFADKDVLVKFDAALFDALIDVREEMLRVFERGVPPVSLVPLQERMDVLSCNRHIRLSMRSSDYLHK